MLIAVLLDSSYKKDVWKDSAQPIPKSEGVRTDRWKYIRYFEQQPVYEELYDLKNDPHEARNKVDDPGYVKELDQLRKRCDELLQRAKQQR